MANPSGANQTLTKVYDASGNALRVLTVGGFAAPGTADAITVTYPTTSSEVYRYRSGGVSGTILMTVTVTYTTASKTILTSVVKT